MVSGFVLGRVETDTPAAVFAVIAGLAMLGVAGVGVGLHMLITPLYELAEQVRGMTLGQRQVQMRTLPTERADEIGTIARAIRDLGVVCIRDHYDARQLRRTLDDRVQRSTKKAVAALSKMAMRDALTELGNRRFLNASLPRLVRAANASHTELVCALIDLDNFKQVNDQLGHATGDELLKLLADLLRSASRAEDLVVRLGGDEFVVFMPGATMARAVEMMAGVRRLFRQRAAAMLHNGPEVDLSMGAASLHEDRCTDGNALMAAADHHLYEAKRRGKGQSCSREGCAAG